MAKVLPPPLLPDGGFALETWLPISLSTPKKHCQKPKEHKNLQHCHESSPTAPSSPHPTSLLLTPLLLFSRCFSLHPSFSLSPTDPCRRARHTAQPTNIAFPETHRLRSIHAPPPGNLDVDVLLAHRNPHNRAARVVAPLSQLLQVEDAQVGDVVRRVDAVRAQVVEEGSCANAADSMSARASGGCRHATSAQSIASTGAEQKIPR